MKETGSDRTWLHAWSKCEFSCGFQCPTCKWFSSVNPKDSCLQKPWPDSRVLLTLPAGADILWLWCISLKADFSKCSSDTRALLHSAFAKSIKMVEFCSLKGAPGKLSCRSVRAGWESVERRSWGPCEQRADWAQLRPPDLLSYFINAASCFTGLEEQLSHRKTSRLFPFAYSYWTLLSVSLLVLLHTSHQ